MLRLEESRRSRRFFSKFSGYVSESQRWENRAIHARNSLKSHHAPHADDLRFAPIPNVVGCEFSIFISTLTNKHP